MEIKVALASSDGISVDEHFGRAARFLIYRLHNGDWELLETRENDPACSGHQHADHLLEQSAALIADCRGVAVAQIGPTAFDLLVGKCIYPLVLAIPVQDALSAFRKSKFINRVRT
ncbi:MAG TPA: NifB/NifX family molybdenum-iron cluster-binding protein [Geomonas sp.]|nr:NifB/NifX family molybdenum-iron cluster-binding protein [Geomonas sp.]